MVIYMIVNRVNGKYYVGKTVQPLKLRWKKHRSDARGNARTAMARAIRRYGEDNFTIAPLMSTLTSDADLKKWERELIAMFRANDPEHGYNLTEGGDGCSGFKHRPETIRRQSEIKKGKRPSAETLLKMSLSQRTKTQTPKTRERIRKSLTGHSVSPETREKIRLAVLLRYQQDPTVREKMRAAKLGKKGGGMSGKKHSDSTREKMSTSQRAAWERRKQSTEKIL